MRTGRRAGARTQGGLRRRARGFAYQGILFAVLALGLAAAAGTHLLGNTLRREKEAELLACGDEIRRAIEHYHAANSAGLSPFPARLESLLRDPHQPGVVRHLRSICRDPMLPPALQDGPAAAQWALILDANRQIVGVRSTSTREPLKRAGFAPPYEAFAKARGYADWQFVASGGVPAQPGTPAAAASGNFIPAPLSAPLGAPLAAPGTPAPQQAPAGQGVAAALAPQAVPEAAPGAPPAAPPARPPEPVPEPVPGVAPAAAAPAVPPPAHAAAAGAAAGGAGAGGAAAPAPAPAPAAGDGGGIGGGGGVQPFVIRAPSGW